MDELAAPVPGSLTASERPAVRQAAELIARALHAGSTLYVAGAGGSTALLADLIAYEYLHGHERPRARGLAAVSLSGGADTPARVEALGADGDVLCLLLPEGEDEVILDTIMRAGRAGMKIVAFHGGGADRVAALADIAVSLAGREVGERQVDLLQTHHQIIAQVEEITGVVD